ncbi:MAG TPA: DUF2811 domain-containing protein [Xenococcaceae cyanobacterium]
MDSQSRVTLSIEIDEALYGGIEEFLTANSDWNRDRIILTSLSLFLIQNADSISSQTYQVCSKTYLHSVCSYFN